MRLVIRFECSIKMLPDIEPRGWLHCPFIRKGGPPPYLNPHISQVRVLVVQRKMRGLQIGMFALRPVRSVLVVGPLLEIGKTSLLMSSWMIHQLGVETVGRLGRAQNRERYSRYVCDGTRNNRKSSICYNSSSSSSSSRSNSSGTKKKNLQKCIVLIFKAVSYQSTRLGQYQAEL